MTVAEARVVLVEAREALDVFGRWSPGRTLDRPDVALFPLRSPSERWT